MNINEASFCWAEVCSFLVAETNTLTQEVLLWQLLQGDT